METEANSAALVLVTGAKTRADTSLHIAQIRKGKGNRSEVRVSITEYGGERRVHVRQWFQIKGCAEWLPTRSGVVVDGTMLAPIIEALSQALRQLDAGALPRVEQPEAAA